MLVIRRRIFDCPILIVFETMPLLNAIHLGGDGPKLGIVSTIKVIAFVERHDWKSAEENKLGLGGPSGLIQADRKSHALRGLRFRIFYACVAVFALRTKNLIKSLLDRDLTRYS